jgi:hypothetical protein
MAERISRGRKVAAQLADQAISRPTNGHLKRKERARRDARLAELVKKGKYPYTPTVMSWLSKKLNKPSSQITEAEAQTAIK